MEHGYSSRWTYIAKCRDTKLRKTRQDVRWNCYTVKHKEGPVYRLLCVLFLANISLRVALAYEHVLVSCGEKETI